MFNSSSTRRTFLVSGTAIAAAASGCTTPLAAAPGQHNFDAHGHFFNADDVPVAEYVQKSILHDQNALVRRVAAALTPGLQATAQALSLSPRAEMTILRGVQAQKGAAALVQQDADLDRAIAAAQKEVARELFQQLRVNAALVVELNATLGAARADKSIGTMQDVPDFSLEFVERSVQFGPALGGETGDEKQLVPVAPFRLSGAQAAAARVMAFLQFVGHMLSLRHHNLRLFMKRTAQGSPQARLSGCVGALVDFTHWLGGPRDISRMNDQVLLHEQLALLSGGFLLPVVGYNPWVDIVDSEASFELLRRAVERHGFVGAKIYPPMGYFPYNNRKLGIKTELARPDLEKLDAALAKFFLYCDDMGVPVMAHTNASVGRDLEHDKVPRAEGWLQLKDIPGLRSVTGHAGHFGGAHAHEEVDWSQQYIEQLMHAEAGNKVRMFADLGYWDELLHKDDTARKKLVRLLQAAPVNGVSAADRVMYGSDWHMFAKVPGWERFPRDVASIIRAVDTDGSIERRVMGGNFMNCYGITPAASRPDGKSNYDRAKAYWSQPGRALPVWLR